MGEASRRGTFEQRKDAAIQKEHDRVEAIEAARMMRYRQEYLAYQTMTWWQEEMSNERHAIITRAKMKSDME